MREANTIESAGPRRAGTMLAYPIGVAVLATLLVCSHRADAGRHQSTLASVEAAAMTPFASADLTASPDVTSPVISVARFSVLRLPVVAEVVEVCLVRLVAIGRLGGLHGP